ncbi:hypothetical protein ACIO3O_37160 [Streptomyces sp. NPDC087440]|uniref:hypothetical protein n=1 Tax=Streptomyces sp. NPDC087440 TaxID=3365790 RepID=UPI0037FF1DB4
MPLNDARNEPGYVCGRIIASFELIAAQDGKMLPRNDLNLSATAPKYTIPRLRAGVVCKALAHMRPRDRRRVEAFEEHLSSLFEMLDSIPERLDQTQRMQYVLGEAHQKVVGLPPYGPIRGR